MNPNNSHERSDPLIDEVRAIRRELSERFGNDVHALGRHLRELEKEHPERIAVPPPRSPARLPSS